MIELQLRMMREDPQQLWRDPCAVQPNGVREETMAAALAVRSFALLAELEALLGRSEQAGSYRVLSDRLAAALVAPVPLGHWDSDHERFVDWVDRSGVVHDHLHLLANVLPVVVGVTDAAHRSARAGRPGARRVPALPDLPRRPDR